MGLLVTVWVGFMFSRWAAKTYCYIKYPNMPVTVGFVMLTKSKCFGRVTVNQWPEQEVMEIVYLGRTHSGEHIRIGGRVGNSTQFVAEATYPTSLKAMNFQEAEFKEIK